MVMAEGCYARMLSNEMQQKAREQNRERVVPFIKVAYRV